MTDELQIWFLAAVILSTYTLAVYALGVYFGEKMARTRRED